ncbi:MAG: BtpA/SgcQ family protein [Eubacteriales bacterium]|nr:BtpA/SgcQ family protein [Christensenellaceae bacterium]MEA5064931.1 BtpA/SgcQ family protein [Eubacteriales bacterium]
MNIRETLGVGKRFVIGMVHCLPLPGTVGFGGDIGKIYAQAVQDARTLEDCGVDAVIVENMGDGPFGVKLDKAQASALAVATAKVRDAVTIPVGVDAAFNDYEASLGIALAAHCQFVRIPVFVDTVEFYGGLIAPCARECMTLRKNLGAEHIMVLADIQVKHTNMLLAHVPIEKSAKDAEGCFADAIIVTGSAIGQETPIEMIERVKKAVRIPVIAGSGVNAKNIGHQLDIADGAIIGSSLKVGGVLSNPISRELVDEVLSALRGQE